MRHLAILSFLAIPIDVAGYVKECWHCFSEKHGNCENPYKGRYRPNSTILKPDCSYDMARAHHSSIIYVLSTSSRIAEIGKNDSKNWSALSTAPNNFECCKSEMDVVTFDGAPKSLVVRGCCHSPSTYDQCGEIENVCREVTMTVEGPNGTVNKATCEVTHCSVCSTNSCNDASILFVSACLVMLSGIVITLHSLWRDSIRVKVP